LGAAWFAFGLLIMTEVTVFWFYQPEVLRGWFAESETEVLVSDTALLNSQILSWSLLVAVFVFLLRRARNWSLLGAGDWGLAKCVAIGTACALGLRVLVHAYVSVWPESIVGLASNIQPATEQMMGAFLDEYGALGLIFSLGIVVPIVEELLFRGVLLQSLAKHLPFGWANLIQACVFAGWHENHRLFPFFIVFGLACGIATRRSRSLVSAIVLHAVNNTLVCITVIALDGIMA
jgi:membrane protease YdiL (CAAX protease family)